MSIYIYSQFKGLSDRIKLGKQNIRSQRVTFTLKSVFPNFSSKFPEDVFICQSCLSLERLSETHTSAVSEHAYKTGHYPLWDDVQFIDRELHWYSRRVKEAIHIRLHPNNINRDSGIEVPEARVPTMSRRHNSRSPPQQAADGPVSSSATTINALDRNPPTMSEVCGTKITNNHGGTNSPTQ